MLDVFVMYNCELIIVLSAFCCLTDLKSANILLSDGYDVKIIDFGLSKETFAGALADPFVFILQLVCRNDPHGLTCMVAPGNCKQLLNVPLACACVQAWP
jgi:serine/threonine protein kinase